MMDMKFNLVSLFSGAGGLDLGFVQSNSFNTLFANDVLCSPAETYEYNFKHKVISQAENENSQNPMYFLGDISSINFDLIKHKNIDVVIGGPPCQDFSIVRGPMKVRKGIDVKRGRLYAQFIRALIHIQPKVFVFENVPGLKSANRGSAYRIILDDFSKMAIRWKEIKNIIGNSFRDGVKNYEVVFSSIVDSSALGIPQKRRRLIIIGLREDLFHSNWLVLNSIKNDVENVLFGRKSLLNKYPLTPFEVFEGLPIPELQKDYVKLMMDYKNVAKEVGTKRALAWEKNIWERLSFEVIKDYITANKIEVTNNKEVDEAFELHSNVLKKLGYYKNKIEGIIISDGTNNLIEESEQVRERMKMIPPDENCAFVKDTKWHVEGKGLSLIYRRLHPLKPAYTVVAYGGGGTWGYHYRRDRARLTNRERARLQTFPDIFLFKGSTSEIRAQIGEAVPPLLGEKIAESVSLILKRI